MHGLIGRQYRVLNARIFCQIASFRGDSKLKTLRDLYSVTPNSIKDVHSFHSPGTSPYVHTSISHQFCRVAWSKWFELIPTSLGLPVYRLWIVSLVWVVFKRILRVRVQFEWTTLHLLAGRFALFLQGE